MPDKRLENKDCNKKQKKIIYNDQEINPTYKYNNCKYIAPNIRAPQHIKQVLTDLKEKLTVTK